jgi:hypothetical protein
MRKSTDIQFFKEVLLHTQKYFALKINSLNKPDEIVSALVNETLDQLEKDIPPINIVFDYVEIHNLVWPVSEHLDPVTASKKVRSHKTKIVELVAKDSTLSKYLKEEGLENYLTFESDDSKGGAGASTNMWLGITDKNQQPKNASNDLIFYRATQIKKPFFWVKPMTNTVLKGWGFWLFILIPICVVSGIPLLLFSISKIQSFIYVLFIVIGIYLLWRIGYIIYELVEKGVAKAPDFMVRLFDINALFTVNREVSIDKEKRRAKEITLVTYEAECTICGDIVFIENGGKEFNNRYVGKCTLAPQEHVFTFDHIKKQGRLARYNIC